MCGHLEIYGRSSTALSQSKKGWAITSIAAGLLLTAGLAKLYQIVSIPVATFGWQDSLWARLILINAELVIAIWLLICRLHIAIWSTIVLFTVFGSYSLFIAFSGHKSCGCFGEIKISPWLTGLCDFLIAGLLYHFRVAPSRHPVGRLATSIALFGSLAVILASSLLAVGAGRNVQNLGTSNNLVIDPLRKLVVLEPQNWIGRPFPLDSFIDIGPQLAKDEWVVVFYHANCADCKTAIPLYERAAEATASPRYAFIALDLLDVDGGNVLFHSTVPLHGHLSRDHEWFATTPLVIRISRGEVINALAGNLAVDPVWIKR